MRLLQWFQTLWPEVVHPINTPQSGIGSSFKATPEPLQRNLCSGMCLLPSSLSFRHSPAFSPIFLCFLTLTHAFPLISLSSLHSSLLPLSLQFLFSYSYPSSSHPHFFHPFPLPLHCLSLFPSLTPVSPLLSFLSLLSDLKLKPQRQHYIGNILSAKWGSIGTNYVCVWIWMPESGHSRRVATLELEPGFTKTPTKRTKVPEVWRQPSWDQLDCATQTPASHVTDPIHLPYPLSKSGHQRIIQQTRQSNQSQWFGSWKLCMLWPIVGSHFPLRFEGAGGGMRDQTQASCMQD